MINITLFSNLQISISHKDWDFLCENRFFTDSPTIDDIQREFVTGTGITPDKKYLWNNASELFAEYIDDLRDIQKIDINKMARNLLSEEEKYNAIKKS